MLALKASGTKRLLPILRTAAPRLKLCSRQLRRLPFVLLLVFVVIIIFFVFFARSDLSSYVCVLLMLVC